MNLEALGVGELLVNSINRDGIMEGYDFDLIERVSEFRIDSRYCLWRRQQVRRFPSRHLKF